MGRYTNIKERLSMKYMLLLSLLLLTSCSTLRPSNPAVNAIYTGISAATDSNSSSCSQGHAQDRTNCRKRNQKQVETLNKSLKKHASQ